MTSWHRSCGAETSKTPVNIRLTLGIYNTQGSALVRRGVLWEQNMNKTKMQADSRKKGAVAARRTETARALSAHARPSGAALRLLRALSEPGAEAMSDPTREGTVIVSSGQGISLGRGSFPSGLARDLARRDLVATTGKG
jgi:hypothetical protein